MTNETQQDTRRRPLGFRRRRRGLSFGILALVGVALLSACVPLKAPAPPPPPPPPPPNTTPPQTPPQTPPVQGISGRVTDGAGNGLANALALATATVGSEIGGDFTDAQGNYTIDVPAGDYRVHFSGGACSEYFDNEVLHALADTVHLDADGSATANAVLECGTISGAVTVGGEPLALGPAALFDSSGNNVANTAVMNGNYTFQNVMPGSYKIHFPVPGCKEWYEDQPDLGSATSVNAVAGSDVTADAAIACDGSDGQITGTLVDTAGNGVSIPVEAYFASDPSVAIGPAFPDESGVFQISLQPGEYKLRFAAFPCAEPPCFVQWYGGSDFDSATVVNVPSGGTVVIDDALNL